MSVRGVYKRCSACGATARSAKCAKCGSTKQAWAFTTDVPPEAGKKRQQRTRSGFATQREAIREMGKLRSEVERGAYATPSRLTVGAYLADWLKGVKGQVRPATYESYTSAVLRVTAAHGELRLQALTKPQIKELYSTLRDSGNRHTGGQLAVQSVMNVHTALRRALGDAVEDGLLVGNPAAGAFKLRPEQPEMRTWTPAELTRFLAAANGGRLSALFRLAATTGLRRGEVLALTWRSIDLDAATVSITQQWSKQGDGQYGFGPPKTDRSRRRLVIDAGTVAELRRHRARQAEERLQWGAGYGSLNLVFCKEDGSPLSVTTLNDVFHRIADRAGLPRLRFHDLRHTAATMALGAGIHPKVVQERLGHSSIAMTMDVYSHALAGMQSEAADRIAAMIEVAG